MATNRLGFEMLPGFDRSRELPHCETLRSQVRTSDKCIWMWIAISQKFQGFPVWWYNVDTRVIWSPKMTHKGPHKVWGCSLYFSSFSYGRKGVRQGRRSGCESQDVLSTRALGNVPPMSITMKSGISLGSPLVSALIPVHPCPVSCDLRNFLATLGCSL